MIERLPEELKEKIITLSGPYVNYILEREPNEEMLFLEGGIMVILGQVLKRGADIRTLLFMKKYLPAYLAIWKAICSTMDPKIITRVCLIWDSWDSSYGYIESINRRFVWGMDHLDCDLKDCSWFMNKAYYKMGMMDKLNLAIDDPFKMLDAADAGTCSTPDDDNIYLKHISDINLKVEYLAHRGDVPKLEEVLREKIDEDSRRCREIWGYGYGDEELREDISWDPDFLNTIVWALAKCHGDIGKAIYIGEKYEKCTIPMEYSRYSSTSIILRLHAFDGLDYMNLTEEKRNLVKAVFNVEGCDKSLIEDPNNKYEILAILCEAGVYEKYYNSECEDYKQDRIGYEELTKFHEILNSDPIPMRCACGDNSGRRWMTEKEFIEKANRCYDYDHVAHEKIGIFFDENNRTVCYPNITAGDSIEEVQFVVAHHMRFGIELKKDYRDADEVDFITWAVAVDTDWL